jgi:hypothetical protein
MTSLQSTFSPENTLFDLKFKDREQFRTYDYVVANPPFSDKTWSIGLTPSQDRFRLDRRDCRGGFCQSHHASSRVPF